MFIYFPLNSIYLHGTTFEIVNEPYCDIPAHTAQYLHTHTTHIIVLSYTYFQFVISCGNDRLKDSILRYMISPLQSWVYSNNRIMTNNYTNKVYCQK
jgi:hypothetical protein